MPYSENFDEDSKIEWMETLWQGWHEDHGMDPNWDDFDDWMNRIGEENWDTSPEGYWAGFLEEMGLRDEDADYDVGDSPGSVGA